MELNANAMQFADTAIVLKEPVLVTLGAVVAVAMAGTWIALYWSWPFGFWEWVGTAAMIVICPLLVWILCLSVEVVIDPVTRRVTQRRRFLNYETAKNAWSFAEFTAVLVERKVSKDFVETHMSGSRSYGSSSSRSYGSSKTVYTTRYILSLLRADTQITLPDKQIAVPHYPLELPMEIQNDPLLLEEAARQLARLGGWPARRRGYALLTHDPADRTPDKKPGEMRGTPAEPPPKPGTGESRWLYRLPLMPKRTAPADLQFSPYIIKAMPHDAESLIDGQ